MNDIEDTIELYEAKEAAYFDGMVGGLLFGIPIGFALTVVLAWLTVDKWLILIK